MRPKNVGDNEITFDYGETFDLTQNILSWHNIGPYQMVKKAIKYVFKCIEEYESINIKVKSKRTWK